MDGPQRYWRGGQAHPPPTFSAMHDHEVNFNVNAVSDERTSSDTLSVPAD